MDGVYDTYSAIEAANIAHSAPPQKIECVTVYGQINDIAAKHPEELRSITTSGDPNTDVVCKVQDYIKNLKHVS